MQNLTVYLGSATPLSLRAGPRAPALSTVPGTKPRPTRQRPLSPLCPAGTPVGARPNYTPRAAWHHHARDSHLFPSPFPSAALPPSRTLPARAAPLVLPCPLLSEPFSRAPELPHRSPHLDCHLRPPAAPSPSRILAEHRRRPPLPGELLPELPIPEISCKSLTPSPLVSCRISSPPRRPSEPPPRRRTPPPDVVCTASPSTCRSGAPLSSPSCPAHSP
jgi:hypothetical protein